MRVFVFEDKSGVSANQSRKLFEHAHLSDEEVAKLAAQYQQFGNIEARNRVVVHFQQLVKRVAGPYLKRNRGHEEDLLSAGRLGLFRALEDFDPTINASFSAHAWQWIRSFIVDEIYKNWDTIHPSRNDLKKSARENNVPAHGVRIDEMRGADGEGVEDPLALLGIHQPPEVDNLLPSLEALLNKFGEALSPRETNVLRRRAQGAGLIELGTELNLSKERIRQIEVAAVEKMRRAVSGE